MIGDATYISAPDYLDPVIGFRAWNVYEDALHPRYWAHQGQAWQVGINQAYCKARLGAEHAAPHPDCHCGLYAYFTPGQPEQISSSLAAKIHQHYPHCTSVEEKEALSRELGIIDVRHLYQFALQLGYHTPLPALMAGRTPAELEPVNAASTPLLTARTGHHAGFPVYGAVAMWGRIEVHQTGMRAEFARVVALVTPHLTPERMSAQLVADIYQVPLVADTQLIELAGACGKIWRGFDGSGSLEV